MVRRFAIACALLLTSSAIATEVPPSEPLRVRSREKDTRWNAASRSTYRNSEIDRRYFYGQDFYNSYYGSSYYGNSWPPAYLGRGFSDYTYRGTLDAPLPRGPVIQPYHRFYGPVPTRWLRR